MRGIKEQRSQQGPSQPESTAPQRNPLRALRQQGQSVWLDYIRRHLISSGELARLVADDGLGGVTSNPSIFEKALTGSTDYDELLASAQRRGLSDANLLYEFLAVGDIQQAADVLRPTYDALDGRDGYVSLEVSPHLAHDTAGTVAEARRLWQTVARPNLMIKVPATPEGLPAIEQLISEGMNVNITLLFAQEMYARVAEAYLSGLAARAARGADLTRVASVASFFVSRIDTAVDAQLTARLETAAPGADSQPLRSLLGKAAIANAKLAYELFKKTVASPRWQRLAGRGARVQRLLWASTSTKNPAYRDVVYVEELIGHDTVNTMPPATLDAFRAHGRVRPSLEDDVEAARATLQALAQAGISLSVVTDDLREEGVRLFAESFQRLLGAIEEKRQGKCKCAMDRATAQLPQPHAAGVAAALEDWRREDKTRRLWARDASLWTGHNEGEWLDWLSVVEDRRGELGRFEQLAAEARSAGLAHAVLLGMGGSSLCPEVLARTFGRQAGYPELLVLDSTDPAHIRALEERLDLARTWFIVSSKSGTTLEPNLFRDYFLERLRQALGAAEAARRFIAITDPGSPLEAAARHARFRAVCHGVPGIGGRYSALSDFGLVPAALMGLDVPRLLESAGAMAHACTPCIPPAENPGVMLGVALGTLARAGRDKVTLVASRALADLGAWLEQLLAESTGKDGRGLIPVDREALGRPEVYGDDRVFVYLRLDGEADEAQDAGVDALRQAGQPVVQIALSDRYDLAQEFFRWEIATAVAGSLLGVNAFDQPDVEASKVETRKLFTAYEQRGTLPGESPALSGEGLHLFADEANAAALSSAARSDRSVRGWLRAYLGRLGRGDYFAVLAYLARDGRTEEALQAIRHAVRDARRVATCLGFGPRFLHSTGQAYKGGPNTGVFLQITCDDAQDLPVPGHNFGFGVVKAAQARGDFQVLTARGRRLLRVHLGADVAAGLATLLQMVREAIP